MFGIWEPFLQVQETVKWSYERRFSNCLEKPQKFRIPVQTIYEATDVGSWSFVGSNLPLMNESTMKWYMKWLIYWTADMPSGSAVQDMIHFIYHFTVRQCKRFPVFYYSMTLPRWYFSMELLPSLVVMACAICYEVRGKFTKVGWFGGSPSPSLPRPFGKFCAFPEFPRH